MVNAFIFVGLFSSSSSSFSRSFRFSFLPEEALSFFLSFLEDLSFFELLPIVTLFNDDNGREEQLFNDYYDGVGV